MDEDNTTPNDGFQGQATGDGNSMLLPVLAALVVLIIGISAYATFTNASGFLKGFNFSSALGMQSGAVAIVNGEEIPRSEYQNNVNQIQQSFETQGADVSGTSTQALIRDQVLQGLVNRKLMMQAAADADVSVSNEEVQSTYDQYIQQAGSEEQLQSQLDSSNLTEQEFRAEIREQMTIEKYVDSQAEEGQLAVTDQEVQQLYNQIASQSTSTPPLAQVRPQIEQRLTQQKRQELISQIVEDLRAEADIRILAQ